jgi:hypothetical protein
MGVMLQAFYWDCPRAENREHQWWNFIKSATTLTIITISASLISKAVCRRGSVQGRPARSHRVGVRAWIAGVCQLVFNHDGGADVEICSAPTAQIHYQPGAAPQE